MDGSFRDVEVPHDEQRVPLVLPSEPQNRHGRIWSDAEEHYLEFNWGVVPLPKMAERLGRTQWGITQHAIKLKLGPFYRGHLSIREFERLSGFSYTKIMRAIRHLDLHVLRVAIGSPGKPRKRRRYALTDEQQEKLLELMLNNPLVYADALGAARSTKGKWGVGRKPTRCVKCGRSSSPHMAKGMCGSCYNARFKKKRQDDKRYQKKLSDAQIAEARRLWREGAHTLVQLCTQFGVGRTTMQRTVRGARQKEETACPTIAPTLQ